MTNGVEHRHAFKVQQGSLHHSQADIRNPHVLGGVRDAGAQFLVTDTRHFGAVQLHAAEAEHRQDSHAEDDDSHTSYPLHQRTP